MTNLDELIAQQRKLMGVDAAAAKAGKEIGMSLAGEKNATLRAIAQGVAEKLAVGGAPVTMDMVMASLLQHGLVHATTAKKPPRNWAGTVFKKGLWVCVGSMPSTRVGNKERHVRAWVLKRYMGSRNANGTKSFDSASNVTEMFQQARKAGWDPGQMEWLVGDHRTSEEYVAMARSGTMMGSKATLVPETIGVMLRRFKPVDLR